MAEYKVTANGQKIDGSSDADLIKGIDLSVDKTFLVYSLFIQIALAITPQPE